jgi:tripartite-type tricarboxylate transporter receptor subunit TctC
MAPRNLPALSLVLLLALPAPAAADAVADFYRGKTLTMLVATSPGGDYDLRARLLARHIGRHIPGEPAIIARNMPGAVGLQAANWLATQAPRDGTVLHAIMQNMSAHQALGGGKVEFDTRKFFWIGNTTESPNVVNSWHTTGIRSIRDVMERELVVGAPGTATSSVYYPKAMNALVGTKFKIVSGYPGGNDVNLAMERGEVGGRGSTRGPRGNRPSRTGSPRRRFSFWFKSRCDSTRSWPRCR